MSPYKILLVEDSEEFQVLVKGILEDEDTKVTCAESGFDAENHLKKDDFNMLLLDVMLPDINGFQLLQKLHAENLIGQRPVIFLTGKSDVSDKVNGLTLGAEDYIVKPFEPAEFRLRINNKLKKSTVTTLASMVVSKGALKIDYSKRRAFSVDDHAGENDLGLT